MAMLVSDPFDALLHLQQALDSFRGSSWLEPGPSSIGAYPPLNVFRKGDDLVVVAELPGVRKDDIKLEVKGRTIRLAGKKTVNQGETASAHRRERLSGEFDRALALPVEIDAERVKAELRDGVLALHLPRADRDKPKAIRIS